MKYFNKIVCLNPSSIQGRQVQNIHFFNEEGIVFTQPRGWLENGYNKVDMSSIDLDYTETLKVKRVVKFDKEKIFLMNGKTEYYERTSYYDIYIHTDFIEYYVTPNYYSVSQNHCYREFKGTMDNQDFIVHQRIEEPLQVLASDIRYRKLSEVKKKIELLNFKDSYSPLFKEIHDLQIEYKKIQTKILKSYTEIN